MFFFVTCVAKFWQFVGRMSGSINFPKLQPHDMMLLLVVVRISKIPKNRRNPNHQTIAWARSGQWLVGMGTVVHGCWSLQCVLWGDSWGGYCGCSLWFFGHSYIRHIYTVFWYNEIVQNVVHNTYFYMNAVQKPIEVHRHRFARHARKLPFEKCEHWRKVCGRSAKDQIACTLQ